MHTFIIPTKAEVSETNQQIFDNLEKGLGMVPNLYAYFAKNETALADYLTLQNRKNTLSGKEREIINLVVSQVNQCEYCLAAHTAVAKLNGFTDSEIIEIRKACIIFNAKYAALATFVKETVVERGAATEAATEALFKNGYTEENLIDIMIIIGDKTVSNYLHKTTRLPIDFPPAVALEDTLKEENKSMIRAMKPEDCDNLFFDAMNRGDIEAALALHEPNARWFQVTGETITGLDGIRSALEGFLALKATFSADITPLTNGDNSVAITRASWRLEGTGPDGQPLTMAAKSTELVRRQPDGSWLFAIIAPGAD